LITWITVRYGPASLQTIPSLNTRIQWQGSVSAIGFDF
jgi:hypothetical protein